MKRKATRKQPTPAVWDGTMEFLAPCPGVVAGRPLVQKMQVIVPLITTRGGTPYMGIIQGRLDGVTKKHRTLIRAGCALQIQPNGMARKARKGDVINAYAYGTSQQRWKRVNVLIVPPLPVP